MAPPGDGTSMGLAVARRAPPRARAMRVPFHVPFLDGRELRSVTTAMRRGALGGGGTYTRMVEDRLRALTGSPHAFFVTSCTHALELALMALGIGRDDEVIVPSFTFASTATCVMRQGARPVFADIDPDTWTLDPVDVARCLSSRTRAIIPVHYAGHPARMSELAALRPARCVIIEDAAHALGATWQRQAAGTIGDAGCFSFHSTKNVTCGEGGALLLPDEDAARRAEYIREKGTNREQFIRKEVAYYSWVSEGSSFVASDLLAAVLVEQLKKLPEVIAKRRALWHRYAEALAPLATRHALTLPRLSPGVESSYHIFAILVDSDRRERLLQRMRARGIDVASHYLPLHRSPYWVQATRGQQRLLPVTERISESLVRLPLYPSLTYGQQDLVIATLDECLG